MVAKTRMPKKIDRDVSFALPSKAGVKVITYPLHHSPHCIRLWSCARKHDTNDDDDSDDDSDSDGEISFNFNSNVGESMHTWLKFFINWIYYQ